MAISVHTQMAMSAHRDNYECIYTWINLHTEDRILFGQHLQSEAANALRQQLTSMKDRIDQNYPHVFLPATL